MAVRGRGYEGLPRGGGRTSPRRLRRDPFAGGRLCGGPRVPPFVARHCLVCGFKSRDSVCPRCNTILRSDRAACRRCGKAFNGWIATCDACGASTVPVQDGPRAREAMTALASIPGISAEQAKGLVARGFQEFPDLVRLALPAMADP